MSHDAPAVGEMAPDFALPDERGEMVQLSKLRGRRVLIYFYPKDDTSGCTKQACGFRDGYDTVEDAGAIILGISPDGQSSHQRFKDKHDLPFPLLVDSDHAVADAYGVWGDKSMYGRTYEGMYRSHFLVDEEGRVIDAQVKVSPAKSVERGLAALDRSG